MAVTSATRRKPVSEVGPDPVDIHVGSRIRLRRTLLGVSQEKLGEAIGLTFQQVQKYERGLNRVSSSKLVRLSEVLDVPVSFFFDCMEGGERLPPIQSGDGDHGHREALELARTYAGITDPSIRLKVREIVRLMAKTGTNDQRPS